MGIIRNASDAYVSEKYPAKNYNQIQKLFLADGTAADTRYAYIYFGLPSGFIGSKVKPSKLRLVSGAGFAGSVTITIQRLTQKFSVNKVNWNNKPTATATGQVQVTKSGAADGTVWEFDVTSLLQTVANGAAWYGFRISATGSAAKWLYSAQTTVDDNKPSLEVAWTVPSDAPENLVPGNGKIIASQKPTLQWDYVDPNGDEALSSAQVRIFTTEALADANGAGDVLDYTFATTEPELDLNTVGSFVALTQVTRWWRVRNTNASGETSEWSEPTSFTRTTKGTLTITNPAASPNHFVTETTPPFTWTFTGRTQQKYEVYVTTPEAPAVRLWESGVTPSTDLSVSPPPGVLKEKNKTYTLVVRIYDDLDRVHTPGDPVYQESTRNFTYQPQNTVSAVTGLTVTTDDVKGTATLQWNDATAADEYVIYRDGKEVLTDQPVNLLVSGTTYKWLDDGGRLRVSHTWEVARKVNGVTSSVNPTVSATTKVRAPMLSLPSGLKPVLLLEPDVDAERVETSDIHYILGNAPPILITQSIRGYEGEVSGVITSDSGLGITADEQLDNLEYFKNNPGTVARFVWINKVLKVVVRRITDQPLVYPDGKVDYLVTFQFFEVGF